MKVKIVSTPETNAVTRRPWYAQHIGEVFHVEDNLQDYYTVYVNHEIRFIPKSNCDVVRNTDIAKIILTTIGLFLFFLVAHWIAKFEIWLVNGYMHPATPITYNICYFVAVVGLFIFCIYAYAKMKDSDQQIRNMDNECPPFYLLTDDKDGRNWTEDFEDENGQYINKCVQCGHYFLGHKRRVVCKKCSQSNQR
jgi:hypothetical protein